MAPQGQLRKWTPSSSFTIEITFKFGVMKEVAFLYLLLTKADRGSPLHFKGFINMAQIQLKKNRSQLKFPMVRWRYKGKKKRNTQVWSAPCLYLLNVTLPPNKTRPVNVWPLAGSISQMIGAWMFCCLRIRFFWGEHADELFQGPVEGAWRRGQTGEAKVCVCVCVCVCP